MTLITASPPKLLNNIVDGLSQAIGASSQIVHMHQDPRWMAIRETLEIAKKGCTNYATFAATKTRIVKAL